jgi:hypothetical protein
VALALSILAAPASIGACSSASTPAAPSSTTLGASDVATSEPTIAATPTAPPATASPSAVAGPSGSPLPESAGPALSPGRYRSTPPFDVPFAFDIPNEGWENWHLIPEFIDVVRYEGADRSGVPPRWLAFAHPTRIRGMTDTAAAGLTPDEAAALFAARTDLEAGAVTSQSVAGRDGVRLDLAADHSNTVLFGGPAGNLALEGGQTARVVILPNGDDLLLVLVIAKPAELEAAWDEAGPILESVEF